jgi:hypothetical protein
MVKSLPLQNEYKDFFFNSRMEQVRNWIFVWIFYKKTVLDLWVLKLTFWYICL